MIGKVKANPAIKIPVIGNGDIRDGEGLKRAFDTYGVDGVMVGRASIGAPWIFRDLKRSIIGDSAGPELSLAEKFACVRRQIEESIDRIDEYRGILHIRRHLAASPLFKGIPNFRETRIAMLRADTRSELLEILASVEAMLASETAPQA